MVVGVIILLLFVIIVFIKGIKIVQQSEELIVERLGQYRATLGAGLHVLVPFVDRVRARVDLREQIMDVPPQRVITSDNVTTDIDIVVLYQITDSKNAIYGIQNLSNGIKNLTATAIRDVIGKMDLAQIINSRAQINLELRATLDADTDKWGCRINNVEIKDVTPTKDVRDSMEKQKTAEMTKKAVILEAEGQRQSAITIAEGEKESRILQAEAEKEANIRRAEGEKQAKILRATGEAESIKQIAEAKAKEIEMVYNAIRAANPDDKLVQLKALEALEEVSKGPANKVFIPFDATKALAGLGAMNETTKE